MVFPLASRKRASAHIEVHHPAAPAGHADAAGERGPSEVWHASPVEPMGTNRNLPETVAVPSHPLAS